MAALRKRLILSVLFFAPAAFSMGVAAQDPTNREDSPAVPVPALRSLVNHCLVSHTASSLQETLLKEGWLQVGGVPSDPSATSDDETRQSIEKFNTVNDRYRVFTHDAQPHIVTFTTPNSYPDEIANFVIDGENLDPATLVRLMVRTLGMPEREGPADPRWRAPLATNSEVRIAKSSIIGNDNGISVVVINRTSAQTNKENPKEQ